MKTRAKETRQTPRWTPTPRRWSFVVGKFGTSVGFHRFLKNITCSFKNKRHYLLLKRLCAFTSLKPLLWCFWIRHTWRTQPLRNCRKKWPSERYRCSCWSSPAWRLHVANNQKPNYQAASYVRTFKNKNKKTSPLVFGITRTIAPSRLHYPPITKHPGAADGAVARPLNSFDLRLQPKGAKNNGAFKQRCDSNLAGTTWNCIFLKAAAKINFILQEGWWTSYHEEATPDEAPFRRITSSWHHWPSPGSHPLGAQ